MTAPPDDFAATAYRHFGVPLDTHFLDHRGRPRPIIERGEPIRELMKVPGIGLSDQLQTPRAAP